MDSQNYSDHSYEEFFQYPQEPQTQPSQHQINQLEFNPSRHEAENAGQKKQPVLQSLKMSSQHLNNKNQPQKCKNDNLNRDKSRIFSPKLPSHSAHNTNHKYGSQKIELMLTTIQQTNSNQFISKILQKNNDFKIGKRPAKSNLNNYRKSLHTINQSSTINNKQSVNLFPHNNKRRKLKTQTQVNIHSSFNEDSMTKYRQLLTEFDLLKGQEKPKQDKSTNRKTLSSMKDTLADLYEKKNRNTRYGRGLSHFHSRNKISVQYSPQKSEKRIIVFIKTYVYSHLQSVSIQISLLNNSLLINCNLIGKVNDTLKLVLDEEKAQKLYKQSFSDWEVVGKRISIQTTQSGIKYLRVLSLRQLIANLKSQLQDDSIQKLENQRKTKQLKKLKNKIKQQDFIRRNYFSFIDKNNSTIEHKSSGKIIPNNAPVFHTIDHVDSLSKLYLQSQIEKQKNNRRLIGNARKKNSKLTKNIEYLSPEMKQKVISIREEYLKNLSKQKDSKQSVQNQQFIKRLKKLFQRLSKPKLTLQPIEKKNQAISTSQQSNSFYKRQIDEIKYRKTERQESSQNKFQQQKNRKSQKLFTLDFISTHLPTQTKTNNKKILLNKSERKRSFREFVLKNVAEKQRFEELRMRRGSQKNNWLNEQKNEENQCIKEEGQTIEIQIFQKQEIKQKQAQKQIEIIEQREDKLKDQVQEYQIEENQQEINQQKGQEYKNEEIQIQYEELNIEEVIDAQNIQNKDQVNTDEVEEHIVQTVERQQNTVQDESEIIKQKQSKEQSQVHNEKTNNQQEQKIKVQQEQKISHKQKEIKQVIQNLNSQKEIINNKEPEPIKTNDKIEYQPFDKTSNRTKQKKNQPNTPRENSDQIYIQVTSHSQRQKLQSKQLFLIDQQINLNQYHNQQHNHFKQIVQQTKNIEQQIYQNIQSQQYQQQQNVQNSPSKLTQTSQKTTQIYILNSQQKIKQKTSQSLPHSLTIKQTYKTQSNTLQPNQQKDIIIQSQIQQSNRKSQNIRSSKSKSLLRQSNQEIFEKYQALEPQFNFNAKFNLIQQSQVKEHLNQFYQSFPNFQRQMFLYTQQELFEIIQKNLSLNKTIDFFNCNSLGWYEKQKRKYLLFGSLQCVHLIAKKYGAIQIQTFHIFNKASVEQKKYLTKYMKFFQKFGYLYQKKIKLEGFYQIKGIIKVPKQIMQKNFVLPQKSFTFSSIVSINTPLSKSKETFLTSQVKHNNVFWHLLGDCLINQMTDQDLTKYISSCQSQSVDVSLFTDSLKKEEVFEHVSPYITSEQENTSEFEISFDLPYVQLGNQAFLSFQSKQYGLGTANHKFYLAYNSNENNESNFTWKLLVFEAEKSIIRQNYLQTYLTTKINEINNAKPEKDMRLMVPAFSVKSILRMTENDDFKKSFIHQSSISCDLLPSSISVSDSLSTENRKIIELSEEHGDQGFVFCICSCMDNKIQKVVAGSWIEFKDQIIHDQFS